jgi:branched-chain amino acid transport system substrate-binding protein
LPNPGRVGESSALSVSGNRSVLRSASGAFLAVAVAVVAALAGCGSDGGPGDDPGLQDVSRSPEAPVVVPPGEPLVVGVSSALTGPVAERGSEYRDAVVLGVRRFEQENGTEIAGHRIEVHAEDDGCTVADQTAVAAERLLARPGLVGVVGPQCSAGAEQALPLYEEAGVVSISGSATATNLTDERPPDGFFFRTAFRNDLQGNVVGDYVADELGADSVVIVDNGETYGTDIAAATTRVMRSNGIAVAQFTAPQGTVDFAELTAEIIDRGPDAVGYAGFNPDAALLLGQLRDAGYEGRYGAFDAAASAREFVEPLGEVAEGTLFAGCSLPLPRDFRDAFADVHGSPPAAAFDGQYADATRALLDAVAQTAVPEADGSLVIEPQALREAVAETDIADGVTGRVRFDERGDRRADSADPETIAAEVGLIGCEVRDGALVPLADAG